MKLGPRVTQSGASWDLSFDPSHLPGCEDAVHHVIKKGGKWLRKEYLITRQLLVLSARDAERILLQKKKGFLGYKRGRGHEGIMESSFGSSEETAVSLLILAHFLFIDMLFRYLSK